MPPTALAFLAVGLVTTMAAAGERPGPGGSVLRPVPFAALAGWAEDDAMAAFSAFAKGCRVVVENAGALRPAREAPPELVAVCAAALARPPTTRAEARSFLESHFEPYAVVPPGGSGFLTGYYEPEVPASREPSAALSAPLLARPRDLVTFPPGESPPGLDPGLSAARRDAGGTLHPYPDRAAIEAGALGDLARPIAHVRDRVEAFLIHVQGSARLRMPDGETIRLTYAGRNGRPYTSIGRLIVAEGHMSLGEMSLERLKAWLRAHPEHADRIMRTNQSYIFFQLETALAPDEGPRGGAGVPLTPGRSLAVDRTLWPYGLPFFLSGRIPSAAGEAPLARLMIAQDTGSAILGPARGDFFWGTGEEAGRLAGLTRHSVSFTVLLPRIDGSAP